MKKRFSDIFFYHSFSYFRYWIHFYFWDKIAIGKFCPLFFLFMPSWFLHGSCIVIALLLPSFRKWQNGDRKREMQYHMNQAKMAAGQTRNCKNATMPLHYWLRPIERGQLGLRNFITCHFIYIQYFRWKFQPCPSFYPHPNISDIFVGDEMNIFWFPLLFLCTSIIKQRAHTQLSIYIHLSNH